MVALHAASQNTDLWAPLTRRGIATIAQREGWYPGQYDGHDGWYQPLCDADGAPLLNNGKRVTGWKNADSHDDFGHDRWRNYPKGLKPLMLPSKSIRPAIARGNGWLNTQEGKADTLSMWAAGIPNAAGIFGSSFVRDTLAADLAAWGVTGLRYFAHPDKTGREAAQKIVNLLDGSGIEVVIKLLADTDGSKRDLNDLWQAVQFDRDAFRDALSALETLPLTAQPKPQRPVIVHRSTAQHEPTTDQLTAWARAALEGVCDTLAGAQAGGRFDAMKAAANRLGTIAAHGWLTETECISGLLSAVETNGYAAKHGHTATEKQVRQYFASGLPYPCELPPRLETQPRNQPTFKKAGSTVNPDLFNHGLTDIAAAALRLCFHQTVGTMLFVWYAAIAAGIFSQDEGIDAVKLADAAQQLGYASDPNQRRKLLRMINKGLEEAAKVGLIQKVPTVCQIIGEDDLTVTSEQSNTVGTFWTLQDPATICAAIWQYLPARSEEQHYPVEDVYKMTQLGDKVKVVTAVLAEPRASWLAADPDAPLIVADVIALGTPKRDLKAEKQAAQVVNSDALYFAKLGTDLTITPLPQGWQFASVREYTAGRWRGLIDIQPDLQQPLWWWARWLGVATRTLAEHRKLAGLEAEQHIDLVPVCSATAARQAAVDRKAFPHTITITNSNGEARRTPFDEKADHVIDAAVKRGATAAVVLQSASTQRVVAAEQPKVKPRKPRMHTPTKCVASIPAIVADIPPARPDLPIGHHTASGYDPEWVRGQLILRMKRIGFIESGSDILNQEGEFVSRLPFRSLSNAQVIELARGRSLIVLDADPIIAPAAVELPAETLAVPPLLVPRNMASIAANRERSTLKTCPQCGTYTDAHGVLCYECDKPRHAGRVIEKTHVNLKTLKVETVRVTL